MAGRGPAIHDFLVRAYEGGQGALIVMTVTIHSYDKPARRQYDRHVLP
jgi:hypothetical protein